MLEEKGACPAIDESNATENLHPCPPHQVTEANKREYVDLIARHRMTGSIKAQIKVSLSYRGAGGLGVWTSSRARSLLSAPSQAPAAHAKTLNTAQAFLDGFWELVPRDLLALFNDHELELLISGLPDIDIADLRANTEYQVGGVPARPVVTRVFFVPGGGLLVGWSSGHADPHRSAPSSHKNTQSHRRRATRPRAP